MDWRGFDTIYGPSNGFIYFIRAGDMVKIGFTRSDPRRRVAALQTGNAEHLRLLTYIAGHSKMETELHDLLRDHRVRGEWFRWTAEVQHVLGNCLGENKFVGFEVPGL